MSNTNSSLFRATRHLTLMAALALACTASFAEKPDWAGGGHGGHGGKHEQKDKHEKHNKHDDRDDDRRSGKQSGKGSHSGDVRVGGYFGDPQRVVIRNYYGEQFKGGHCPPGLAKKNNGCLPPGQAKKYAVGRPLMRDVVYYPVPQTVVYQLGVPPSGYKYVRVASDILLIAIGTSMVVDAIQDLGGL